MVFTSVKVQRRYEARAPLSSLRGSCIHTVAPSFLTWSTSNLAGRGLVELTEPFGRFVRLELKPAENGGVWGVRYAETADRLPGLLRGTETLVFNILVSILLLGLYQVSHEYR